MPKNPILWRGLDGVSRQADTEWKLLERIAQIAEPQSRGTVALYSERVICESCPGVISDFRSRYPGIQLNVYSGGK
ncbi:deaminase domain-containing protein [Kribbella qitaiheensis]